MNADKLDTNAYGLMLEELLQRLKQEIDSHFDINTAPTDSELDQYILKINSFYYEGFLKYYLPQFEQRWHAEARELLMLAQQQQVLETNIMSTLKRYTRLHNLLKTLLAGLTAFCQNTDYEMHLIQEEITRQGSELLSALSDLHHQLNSLKDFLTSLLPYLKDDELTQYIGDYPAYIEVFQLFGSSAAESAIGSHKLALAISELSYLINLAGNTAMADQKQRLKATEEMQRRIDLLKDEVDSDDPFNSWISRHLASELSLYAAALSDSMASPDLQALILKRLQGWRKTLQVINSCGSKLLQPDALYGLICLSAENAQEALRDIEFSIEQLHKIIAGLEANPEPSYKTLVQVREWLAFWGPFLRSMSGEEEMRRVPRLNSLLHQVKVGISFLSNQLSMIETSRRRSAYNQDYVGRMRDLAATQLGVLMQLKADLDRLLAPRNVSRTWKDMGVRLTKIPLQKGEVFPEEHIRLLTQAHWDARLDPEQADYTIVHEEGDLFIIQVLNEEQVEIPYMVLTRRA